MKWLLWREYRLNRLILATGAVLLCLPYLIAAIALVWPVRESESAPGASVLFFAAGVYSLIVTQLAVALLGGNAMAGERADRSAEFMAYLPVRRSRRLVAKMALALLLTACIWGVNLLIGWILLTVDSELLLREPDYAELVNGARLIAVTGLVFYGVGWLVSSFQSSSTFAVAAGLLTPLLVISGLLALDWLLDSPANDSTLQFRYSVICVMLAVVSFTGGTLLYLNRVEP